MPLPDTSPGGQEWMLLQSIPLHAIEVPLRSNFIPRCQHRAQTSLGCQRSVPCPVQPLQWRNGPGLPQ